MTAARGKNPDGYELWRGPSAIDGQPIGVVVTHLRKRPQNRKIGNMAQAWILPLDTPPNNAARTGEDVSVCGSCRFRPSTGGGCYVPIFATSHRVWWAWRKFGSYEPIGVLPPTLTKPVRIGAWGDPGAVPVDVWRRLLAVAPGWTAYTHRWRDLDVREWSWCMASVDSVSEAVDAQLAGWRTFRARVPGTLALLSEIVCPNTTHGMLCADCKLCRGGNQRVKSIVLDVHGQHVVTATRTLGGVL